MVVDSIFHLEGWWLYLAYVYFLSNINIGSVEYELRNWVECREWDKYSDISIAFSLFTVLCGKTVFTLITSMLSKTRTGTLREKKQEIYFKNIAHLTVND